MRKATRVTGSVAITVRARATLTPEFATDPAQMAAYLATCATLLVGEDTLSDPRFEVQMHWEPDIPPPPTLAELGPSGGPDNPLREATPTERSRALAALRVPRETACDWCGTVFSALPGHRYCSKPCANRHYQRTHKAELNEKRRAKTRALREKRN